MKKKNVYIVVLTLLIISLFSCNYGSDSSQVTSNDSVKMGGLPDTIKSHLIKQDSLYKGLVAQIDSMTVRLNDSKKQVEVLQTEMNKLQEPGQVLALITLTALFLSIIAIILCIFKTRNKLSKKTARDFLNTFITDSIEDLNTPLGQIKDIRSRVQGLELRLKDKKSTTGMDFSNVEKRLSDLERIRTMEKRNNSTQHPSDVEYVPPREKVSHNEIDKIGYTNINSGIYFVDLFDSKQETCVFSLTFKGEDRAIFNIISLDKLKSRNGWQEVVEATGNCTMAEATDYIVIEYGKCKKIDANTWQVIDKLKIKILK